MSYRTDVTGATVLPGSTPCVLCTTAVLNQIRGLFFHNSANATTLVMPQGAYAINSGGVFTFHAVYPPDFTISPSLTLPLATLDGALIGGTVLLDDGTGHWRMATVLGDGSTFIAGGVSVPLTSRAAALSNLSGYVGASSQNLETFALTGTSVDGHIWFTGSAGATVFSAVPLSTIGALAGSQALVEVSATPSTWRVMSV